MNTRHGRMTGFLDNSQRLLKRVNECYTHGVRIKRLLSIRELKVSSEEKKDVQSYEDSV